MTLWMERMIWMELGGWVVSYLNIVDEIAGSLQTDDVSHFVLIKLKKRLLIFTLRIQ
ncbi:hypothetical protein PHJA_000468900 [Phtheirospermum japonicum]|uniref:Uncharacterized protein n=1 Tax=Phtheirospermum japonicum TaxID=374723 RepID=A0A830BH82_9LAMI|nr:hypothetical protein PHJA_000468900 [Phtheirospermum japonicum]